MLNFTTNLRGSASMNQRGRRVAEVVGPDDTVRGLAAQTHTMIDGISPTREVEDRRREQQTRRSRQDIRPRITGQQDGANRAERKSRACLSTQQAIPAPSK